MINSIPLGDSDYIHHTNILEDKRFTFQDLTQASKDVVTLKNILFEGKDHMDKPFSPGIQFSIHYNFSDIVDRFRAYIREVILKMYTEDYGIDPGFNISTFWIYYQHNSSKPAYWHSHPKSNLLRYDKTVGRETPMQVPNYKTCVLYLQVPEDVKESGKIWFSPNRNLKLEKDNKVTKNDISVAPKQGDLLIFPYYTPHFPELHTGKTARIVLGSNIYIKKPKSII